jgi:hypothetical protein
VAAVALISLVVVFSGNGKKVGKSICGTARLAMSKQDLGISITKEECARMLAQKASFIATNTMYMGRTILNSDIRTMNLVGISDLHVQHLQNLNRLVNACSNFVIPA